MPTAPIDMSVIVPTHERRALLAEVLSALERQEHAPQLEVVVVDDGSRDGTADWLAGRRSTVPMQVLSQPQRGPAAARNAGVRAARGHFVAFLGDDTIPEPGWLAAHAARHGAAGNDPRLAVIGRTHWHPRVRTTAFLRYINEHGAQFGYALIRDPDDLPFNFFYTSNVSLHRELALAEPFDEGFPHAAWEDIELAYRLKRRGLRLVYEPSARAAHDHPTDVVRFGRRQEKAGFNAVVFYSRHPELGGFLGLGPEGPPPLGSRALARGLESLARVLERLPVAMPGLWDRVLRHQYLRGLHDGWRAGAPGP
jgi:glycosyltransferase involved in cell wall biosynthesis